MPAPSIHDSWDDDAWDHYTAWCDASGLDPDDGWQNEFAADMADLRGEELAAARAGGEW